MLSVHSNGNFLCSGCLEKPLYNLDLKHLQVLSISERTGHGKQMKLPMPHGWTVTSHYKKSLTDAPWPWLFYAIQFHTTVLGADQNNIFARK